jgi:hypothetical protein
MRNNDDDRPRRRGRRRPYENPLEMAQPSDAGIPPAISQGAIHAFFVYDVADTIDLAAVHIGETPIPAPLVPRREALPGTVQFPVPPLDVRLPAVTAVGREARVRAKIFDYGVVSLRLTFDAAGSWESFVSLAGTLRSDRALVEAAHAALERLTAELGAALDDPHEPLVEDYFVFEVRRFAAQTRAADLIGRFAPALATLIAGEERRLGEAEQADLLRSHHSYFDDDLVVVHWDAAFVYDRPEGTTATEDILEFANTQLVELRTYDHRLNDELDRIYRDEPRRTFGPLARKAAFAAAERLRYLIVDVLELTDRSSNALKITGDAYYARLYRTAAKRLGLGDWQRLLDAKIETVNDLYRFSADDAQNARAEFLELIVIVLIAVEIVIGILTLTRGL